MKANTTIHTVNTYNRSCIITLYDCEGDLVFDHVNIGIELNTDGTANGKIMESKIKEHVFLFQENKHNPKL